MPKEPQPWVMVYPYETPLLTGRNFCSHLNSLKVIVKVHFPKMALSCTLYLGMCLVLFAMASQSIEHGWEGGRGLCVCMTYTLEVQFRSITGTFLLRIKIQLLSSSEILGFPCKKHGLEKKKKKDTLDFNQVQIFCGQCECLCLTIIAAWCGAYLVHFVLYMDCH